MNKLGKRKQYYRRLKYPPWLLTARDTCAAFILPLTAFQFFRTLLFPTPFDVVILLVLVGLSLALFLEWF